MRCRSGLWNKNLIPFAIEVLFWDFPYHIISPPFFHRNSTWCRGPWSGVQVLGCWRCGGSFGFRCTCSSSQCPACSTGNCRSCGSLPCWWRNCPACQVKMGWWDGGMVGWWFQFLSRWDFGGVLSLRQTLTTTCFGKVLKYFIPLGQSGNSYRVGVVFWFGGAEVPLPQSDEGNGRTIFVNGLMHSGEISILIIPEGTWWGQISRGSPRFLEGIASFFWMPFPVNSMVPISNFGQFPRFSCRSAGILLMLRCVFLWGLLFLVARPSSCDWPSYSSWAKLLCSDGSWFQGLQDPQWPQLLMKQMTWRRQHVSSVTGRDGMMGVMIPSSKQRSKLPAVIWTNIFKPVFWWLFSWPLDLGNGMPFLGACVTSSLVLHGFSVLPFARVTSRFHEPVSGRKFLCLFDFLGRAHLPAEEVLVRWQELEENGGQNLSPKIVSPKHRVSFWKLTALMPQVFKNKTSG